VKIAIVIINDRHCDTEALPFADPKKAVEYAEARTKEYCRYPEDLDVQLNEHMVRDNWIYHAIYSCEGDSITVLLRDLQ
jgi:hypothetical protein